MLRFRTLSAVGLVLAASALSGAQPANAAPSNEIAAAAAAFKAGSVVWVSPQAPAQLRSEVQVSALTNLIHAGQRPVFVAALSDAAGKAVKGGGNLPGAVYTATGKNGTYITVLLHQVNIASSTLPAGVAQNELDSAFAARSATTTPAQTLARAVSNIEGAAVHRSSSPAASPATSAVTVRAYAGRLLLAGGVAAAFAFLLLGMRARRKPGVPTGFVPENNESPPTSPTGDGDEPASANPSAPAPSSTRPRPKIRASATPR